MYDIIIVGAGPAGLTAAIYALRADKKVLLLEKETFGGQITYSPRVENYPSQMAISGNELAQMMLDQVMEHGAEIELAEVRGQALWHLNTEITRAHRSMDSASTVCLEISV